MTHESGGKGVASIVAASIPALVSPIIEAAIAAFDEHQSAILKGYLVQALEQVRALEATNKENARLATDRWTELQKKDAIIAKLRDDILVMQKQGGPEA